MSPLGLEPSTELRVVAGERQEPSLAVVSFPNRNVTPMTLHRGGVRVDEKLTNCGNASPSSDKKEPVDKG